MSLSHLGPSWARFQVPGGLWGRLAEQANMGACSEDLSPRHTVEGEGMCSSLRNSWDCNSGELEPQALYVWLYTCSIPISRHGQLHWPIWLAREGSRMSSTQPKMTQGQVPSFPTQSSYVPSGEFFQQSELWFPHLHIGHKIPHPPPPAATWKKPPQWLWCKIYHLSSSLTTPSQGHL